MLYFLLFVFINIIITIVTHKLFKEPNYVFAFAFSVIFFLESLVLAFFDFSILAINSFTSPGIYSASGLSNLRMSFMLQRSKAGYEAARLKE